MKQHAAEREELQSLLLRSQKMSLSSFSLVRVIFQHPPHRMIKSSLSIYGLVFGKVLCSIYCPLGSSRRVG